MLRAAKLKARFALGTLTLVAALLAVGSPAANAGKPGVAYIAVIIDDVGNRALA